MRTLLLSSCICLLLWTGCKKSDNASVDYGQGTGHCRLTSWHNAWSSRDTNTRFFQYNSDGKLSGVIYRYLTTSFTYNGNIVTSRTIDTAGGIFELDTAITDGVRILSVSSSGVTGYSHTTFSYNNDNQPFYSYTTLGNSEYKEYLSWSGGDMVRDSVIYITWKDTDVIDLEYYPDKPRQPAGSETRVNFCKFGMAVLPNKHLLKTSQYHGGDKTIYYHTFDSEGKLLIDSVARTFNNPYSTERFTYDCR